MTMDVCTHDDFGNHTDIQGSRFERYKLEIWSHHEAHGRVFN
jgi:hypothetical protein